ncbi:MAG TPA: ribose-phosphate pyrophosphokinase [Candidatus Lokiarchaeia archaeon]|nr:ribose-phosphate pyrophosphokinase [Candidatus Lokiarchaeia archaeon]
MASKFIVAGPASQSVAVQVANLLEIPVVETEFKKFPDGENYIRLNVEDESIFNGSDMIIIQSADFPQNDHLMELFYLISIAKRVEAASIRVVVPYLAYSRQDKVFRPGEAISAKLILQMIVQAGANEFVTIDIHAPEVLSNLGIPATSLDSTPLLANYLKSRDLVNPVVISPDKGSRDRSAQFASLIGAELVLFDKSRDRITGEIDMEGEAELNGRDVAIVDDIIATGGTMATALGIAKNAGARNLYALCSHALLIGNALFKLSKLECEVIGTNAVNSPVSVVSVAPIIAKHFKE